MARMRKDGCQDGGLTLWIGTYQEYGLLQSEFLYAAFYDARFECNNSRLRIVNNNSALEQREGTRLRTISIAPQKESYGTSLTYR